MCELTNAPPHRDHCLKDTVQAKPRATEQSNATPPRSHARTAVTPPKGHALSAFSSEGGEKQTTGPLNFAVQRAPQQVTRGACSKLSCSPVSDMRPGMPPVSVSPRRRYQGNHLEQAFNNLLFKTAGSKKSRLERLREAALFLFTEGTGKLSSDVLGGKQGGQGPQFATIMVLRRIMESLTLADFDLCPSTVLWNYRRCREEQRASGTSRVALCCNVVNTPEVCIAMFLLPKGCPLEMHGHPGMVVVTKVLLGTLHVKIASALSDVNAEILSTSSERELQTKKEQETEKGETFEDPGLSCLRLNERIFDFGATPDDSVKPMPSNMTGNTNMSGNNFQQSPSSIRRRLLQGSRMRRRKGDIFEAIELYNDVVSGYNGLSSPSATSLSPSSSSSLPSPVSSSNRHNDVTAQPRTDTAAGDAAASVNSVSPRVVTPMSGSGSRSVGSPERSTPINGGWADVLPNKEAGLPSTFVCTPVLGNLHRFESMSPFVLLVDLISPGYGTPETRDCQYFIERTVPLPDVPSADIPLPDQTSMSVGKQSYRKLLLEEVDETVAGPDIFLEMTTSTGII